MEADIAYEIWGCEQASTEWRIVVDEQVLGLHISKLDAVRYAIREARETWEERCLRTEVLRCRADGRRQRIAMFGE